MFIYTVDHEYLALQIKLSLSKSGEEQEPLPTGIPAFEGSPITAGELDTRMQLFM